MTRLKIMPLGGVGETGALNCMLYETEDTAILVDCGVGFADERHPGANLILIDFNDLESYRDKLKAIVLTHGHEDHLGAVGFLRQKFNIPIYATPFTMGIVRQKFSQRGLELAKLNQYEAGDSFTIGDINVETVFINHSILDAAALLISTDEAKVFHITDFKIDHSAPGGKVIDLARIKKMGEEGLDLLLMDSTNVFSRGWTTSETTVRANLLERFTKIKGRIIACLFSSNMYRIQSLVECARITGRKISFTGRSTKEYTRIAREIAKLDLNGVELYDVEDIARFPDSEVLLLVTGSQAEPRSVLQRLSHDMFKPFRLRENDTLLMSSKMIPGNEGPVLEMLDRIALLGPEIITEDLELPIHASGHAKQDELREILRLTKPRYFIPIHGSYRHLKKHLEIAHDEGLKPEQTILILNGDQVEVAKDNVRQVNAEIFNRIFLDESDTEIKREALSRRRKFAFNGVVGVGTTYDTLRKVFVTDVSLDLSAMHGGEFGEECLMELRDFLGKAIAKAGRMERDKVEKFIKVEVRQFYKHKLKIRPEVMVLVSEV